MDTHQAIKVFILMKKFSLMNQLMKRSHAMFHVDFLIMAIETDAMDIAYYFFQVYEEEYMHQQNEVINATINSLEKSNQFLRVKIRILE